MTMDLTEMSEVKVTYCRVKSPRTTSYENRKRLQVRLDLCKEIKDEKVPETVTWKQNNVDKLMYRCLR